MHRGSQQWVPTGSCPPNYPPHYGSQVMSEQYRLGSAMPHYGPSVGPCISPHSRVDSCGIPMQVSVCHDYSLLMIIVVLSVLWCCWLGGRSGEVLVWLSLWSEV